MLRYDALVAAATQTYPGMQVSTSTLPFAIKPNGDCNSPSGTLDIIKPKSTACVYEEQGRLLNSTFHLTPKNIYQKKIRGASC